MTKVIRGIAGPGGRNAYPEFYPDDNIRYAPWADKWVDFYKGLGQLHTSIPVIDGCACPCLTLGDYTIRKNPNGTGTLLYKEESIKGSTHWDGDNDSIICYNRNFTYVILHGWRSGSVVLSLFVGTYNGVTIHGYTFNNDYYAPNVFNSINNITLKDDYNNIYVLKPIFGYSMPSGTMRCGKQSLFMNNIKRDIDTGFLSCTPLTLTSAWDHKRVVINDKSYYAAGETTLIPMD